MLLTKGPANATKRPAGGDAVVQVGSMSGATKLALAAAGAIAAICGSVMVEGRFPGEARAEERGMRATDLPLPRFVSLKSNSVNVRRGPGQDYDVLFTFV